MRKYFFIGILAAPLLLTVSACGHQIAPELKQKSAEFSQSVNVVRTAVFSAFELAETANRLAQQSNLNLQYDLGARPPVDFKPLFTHADLQARQSVLDSLSLYALRLSRAFGVEAGQTALPDILNPQSLADLDFKAFDTNNLLSNEGISTLKAGAEEVSRFLTSSKSEEEMAGLVRRMQPAIERLSFLLYLDVGFLGEGIVACGGTSISLTPPVDVATLPDCRGGLRPVLQDALSETATIWRQRLSLSSPKELQMAKGRSFLLDQIYGIETAKTAIDGKLMRLQKAILMIARLHKAIAQSFQKGSGEGSPAPFLRSMPEPVGSEHLSSLLAQLNTDLRLQTNSLLTLSKDRQHAPQ